MNSPREINKNGLDKYRDNADWMRAVTASSIGAKREIPEHREGMGPDDYDFNEADLKLLIVNLRKKADKKDAEKILKMAEEAQEKIISLRTRSRESGGMSIEEERLLLPGETVIDPYGIDEGAYEERKVDEKIDLLMTQFVNTVDGRLRKIDTENNLNLFDQLDVRKKRINLRSTVEMMVELTK